VAWGASRADHDDCQPCRQPDTLIHTQPKAHRYMSTAHCGTANDLGKGRLRLLFGWRLLCLLGSTNDCEQALQRSRHCTVAPVWEYQLQRTHQLPCTAPYVDQHTGRCCEQLDWVVPQVSRDGSFAGRSWIEASDFGVAAPEGAGRLGSSSKCTQQTCADTMPAAQHVANQPVGFWCMPLLESVSSAAATTLPLAAG